MIQIIVIAFFIRQVLGAAVHICHFGQFWHEVFEMCRNCSDVCEPLSRPVCPDLCRDYFLHHVFSTTTRSTTTTTLDPVTAGLQTPVASREDTSSDLALKVAIISISILFIVVAVFIVKWILDKRAILQKQGRDPAMQGNRGNAHEMQPLKEEEQVEQPQQRQQPPADGRHQIQRSESVAGIALYDKDKGVIRIDGLEQFLEKRPPKSV